MTKTEKPCSPHLVLGRLKTAVAEGQDAIKQLEETLMWNVPLTLNEIHCIMEALNIRQWHTPHAYRQNKQNKGIHDECVSSLCEKLRRYT